MTIARALDEAGCRHLPGAARLCLSQLDAGLRHAPSGRVGVRLRDDPGLVALLAAEGRLGRIAARWLGAETRAVRAVLFDKSADANWALGWHQDRTICVAERRDVPGYGPWTVKQGLIHVAPPAALLGRMVTMRVHLGRGGRCQRAAAGGGGIASARPHRGSAGE